MNTPQLLDINAKDDNGNNIIETAAPERETAFTQAAKNANVANQQATVNRDGDPVPQSQVQTLPNGEAAPAPKYIGIDWTGGVSTGLVVDAALDRDGDQVTYRMARHVEGQNHNNLVTLGIVDGKLTIVWLDGGGENARPNFEDMPEGGWIFVVEAVTNSELPSERRQACAAKRRRRNHQPDLQLQGRRRG